jgi:hypothetical protein
MCAYLLCHSVIAVHGLGGHAFGSWSYVNHQSQSHVMWLRDFLGEDVPQVRILVYGYEARLDKTTTMSRLLDYRRSLLGQLLNSRRGMEQRPLILFGHSFGGTLIAQVCLSTYHNPFSVLPQMGSGVTEHRRSKPRNWSKKGQKCGSSSRVFALFSSLAFLTRV